MKNKILSLIAITTTIFSMSTFAGYSAYCRPVIHYASNGSTYQFCKCYNSGGHESCSAAIKAACGADYCI